jgi:hypothetical protein
MVASIVWIQFALSGGRIVAVVGVAGFFIVFLLGLRFGWY